MSDYNKLILGEDDSQTAPVCNGTVREMLAEIDRIKAELEKASTIANDNYQVILKCNGQVNELKRQLAEARHSYDVLKMVYDNLEKTHYETTYGRVQRLESQLASARAENERLKEEIRHYEDQGLWIPDKAEEARKDAAREIIEQLDKQQPYHENATYLFIRDYIVKTFGLEGWGMREISLDLQLRHAKSCLVEYGEKLKKAELQLAKARREGWEQGKREALCAATLHLCNPVGEKIADAIASMGYKEKAND